MTEIRPQLSELAEAVLDDHRQKPDVQFYDIDRLGSMFRDEDLKRLDGAYTELVEAELLERSGSVVSFFGHPKPLYRLRETSLNGDGD